MPVIRITEKDFTKSGTADTVDSIVYIPGKMGIDATESAGNNKPTLCRTKSEFTKYFGTKPANLDATHIDMGWVYAYNLINAGLYVLYEAVSYTPGQEAVAAVAGTGLDVDDPGTEGVQYYTRAVSTAGAGYRNDGTYAYTPVDSIPATHEANIYFPLTVEGSNAVPGEGIDITTSAFWDRLADKSQYNIRFLTMMGSDGTIGNVGRCAQHMVACAEKRGDCVALLDHDKKNGNVDWTASTIRALFGTGTTLTSKYAAMYTPWCKFGVETSTTSGTKDVELPGSFGYLSAYAVSIKSFSNWYAVAGSFRGTSYFTCDPLIKWTTADINALQGRSITEAGDFGDDDNKTFAINTINYVEPFGNIVWGNRTLHKNTDGLVASSFMNIRQLACDLKKVLYKAARKYTFEQNSDVLWVNFKSQITPTLERMLSGEGISGYKIIKKETGIKGRLTAIIRIIPIEAVEDFDLTVELADSLEVVE